MLSPALAPRAASIEAIVIGASAGAVAALSVLLPALPADLRAPVVVVVHLSSRTPSLLAAVFAPRCALPVAEPEDKQPLAPGIWFAPPDYHLLIEHDRTFSLSVDDPVHWSRPSIDVLLQSATDAYGASLAAVILSGANDDGASGAAAVRRAGGLVLVQDPATAEAPEMPRASIAAATPQLVGTLDEIAQALLAAIREGRRR